MPDTRLNPGSVSVPVVEGGGISAQTPDDAGHARLLARCGTGDREAFMALYDSMSPRIFGLVRALLGTGPRADDAFQDAMWDIWRRASSYDRALGSAEAWMLMIARSRAIDLMRREQRAARVREAHAATELASDASSHESRAGDHERAQACERALAGLAQEQASVIRLAYLRGLSREQIASAMGIPVGTVKTRIRSGIRSISERMAGGPAS